MPKIIKIQCSIRQYLAKKRRREKEEEERAIAAYIIQENFRKYLSKKAVLKQIKSANIIKRVLRRNMNKKRKISLINLGNYFILF